MVIFDFYLIHRAELTLAFLAGVYGISHFSDGINTQMSQTCSRLSAPAH